MSHSQEKSRKVSSHHDRKVDISDHPDEDTKDVQLTRDDKMEAFNLLIWASLSAIFLSFWQIIIPFYLFPLNFSQLFLGITSIFFLVVSMIMLWWSHSNYKWLELNKEEHKHLPTAHIEGTIYVISFILIACYLTFLVGILIEESYSWSLLVANGVGAVEASKQAIVIVISQVILIIGDIAILSQYVRFSYHLEFLPKHLPFIIGFFFSAFIVSLCLLIGKQNYLRSFIGGSNENFIKQTEDVHTKMFWAASICIIATLVFMFENRQQNLWGYFYDRATQLQQKPKLINYYWPSAILGVIGFYLLINSFTFYFYAAQINKHMKADCKATIQTYSQDFSEQIGCPYKYLTFSQSGKMFYSQNCPTQNIGIVWEQDYETPTIRKKNQLSCLNMNCCYLIAEKRSLNYKEYFLLVILSVLLSWICAGHCLDLTFQEPKDVKAGPNLYSVTKLASQISVSILAICVAGFFLLQYQPEIPRSLPFILDAEEEVVKFTPNRHLKVYPHEINLESIPQCKKIDQAIPNRLRVAFNEKLCPSAIQKNVTLCNKELYGFAICLTGTNGMFQLDPMWDAENAKISSLDVFDPYLLQQTLRGIKTNDVVCAEGREIDINELLEKYLFFCKNPGKEPTIQMDQKQVKLDFAIENENIESTGSQEYHRLLVKKQIKKYQISETLIKNLKNEIETKNEQSLMPADMIKAKDMTTSIIKPSEQENVKSLPVENIKSIPEQSQNKGLDFMKESSYGSINVIVFDAEHSQLINRATVTLYEDAKDCKLLDEAIFFPIRKIETDSDGEISIRNIKLKSGSSYQIQARADGYLFNCFFIKELQAGQQLNIQLPLVPSLKENHNMKILLFYQKPQLDIELGATFNFDENNQCNVGYFNDQCSGMFFTVAYENQLLQLQKPAQVIKLHKIGLYDYLFFVKIVKYFQFLYICQLPTDMNLKNTLNNNQKANEDQQVAISNLNEALMSSGAIINVYVKDRQFPVGVYEVPLKRKEELANEQFPATWLALCMNGSIGPITQSEINHFWSTGTGYYWQRKPSQSWIIPNAEMCIEHYKEHGQKIK